MWEVSSPSATNSLSLWGPLGVSERDGGVKVTAVALVEKSVDARLEKNTEVTAVKVKCHTQYHHQSLILMESWQLDEPWNKFIQFSCRVHVYIIFTSSNMTVIRNCCIRTLFPDYLMLFLLFNTQLIILLFILHHTVFFSNSSMNF